MRKILAKIMDWYRLGKVAKVTVCEHLSRGNERRFVARIAYRLRDGIVVCAAYRDREVPRRSYHLFDPGTGGVRDVEWAEVRKMVPVRKSRC
jgi:hypothetical protein